MSDPDQTEKDLRELQERAEREREAFEAEQRATIESANLEIDWDKVWRDVERIQAEGA